MNLNPLPPSDNLYKFMCLFGLTLVIFCFVYPIIKAEEVAAVAFPLLADTGGFQISEKTLDESIAAKTKEMQPPSADTHPMNNPLPQRQSDLADLRAKRATLEMTRAKAESQSAELKIMLINLQQLRVIAWIGLAFGGSICGAGGRLWYIKVQKLQDELLWEQVREMREKRFLKS